VEDVGIDDDRLDRDASEGHHRDPDVGGRNGKGDISHGFRFSRKRFDPCERMFRAGAQHPHASGTRIRISTYAADEPEQYSTVAATAAAC
jgi:hypothetical protein